MGDAPLRVKSVVIYPVKSCRGVTPASAEVGPKGFVHDRQWVIVDAADNTFVTQRTNTALGRIQPQLAEDPAGRTTLELHDTAAKLQPLSVAELTAATAAAAARRTIKVWDYEGEACDCGDEASRWVTQVIGGSKTYRLMQFAPEGRRDVVPQVKDGFPTDQAGGYEVGFADACPYLLCMQSSIEEMNRRAAQAEGYDKAAHAIDARRFRPNIIVEGGAAFADDRWRLLRVGDAVVHAIHPCERCVLTTVNPDTLKLDRVATPSNPLTLFRAFRDFGSGPMFGTNCVSPSLGVRIAPGDVVVVVEEKTEAQYQAGVNGKGAGSRAAQLRTVCGYGAAAAVATAVILRLRASLAKN